MKGRVGMIPSYCAFCKKPSVDSLEFEAGHMNEVMGYVDFCRKHLEEYEKDEWAFIQKHRATIEEEASMKLIREADYERD